MAKSGATELKNVVLVGHGGCGKTMLAEALLFDGSNKPLRPSVQIRRTRSEILATVVRDTRWPRLDRAPWILV